jgi:hypothetical protein
MKTVNVVLNTFDDAGNVVDTTNMDITTSQVSDIVDHAAQLVLIADTVDDISSEELRIVLSNLREALESAGVI